MSWKSVSILGKPQAAEQSLSTFQELYRLFQQWHINAHFETEVGALLGFPASYCLTTEQLIAQSDLILVVGGDGSMLNAAKLAVEYNKPVIGINRGHLGFLTDIGAEELETRLYKVLHGEFWQEQRSLLQGELVQQEIITAKHTALNDIVLSLGSSSQLIEFDLWINDIFVCRQRADGLIISSPTGSTAYALSAGGPIAHPELKAIVIVPMLPHKLSSRPIVVSNDSKIKILLRSKHKEPAQLSFDSQQRCDLFGNDMIHINRFSEKLTLIHPNDYDYFQTLRDKLHWESR
jgi:NAD+ kinase